MWVSPAETDGGAQKEQKRPQELRLAPRGAVKKAGRQALRHETGFWKHTFPYPRVGGMWSGKSQQRAQAFSQTCPWKGGHARGPEPEARGQGTRAP